jgi:hypothetical protein
MRKTLPFLFAAAMAAASFASTDALAFNTCKPSAVFLLNGYVTVPLGTWITELNEYVDCNGYEACSFFVKWIDAAILPMTSQLFIDELVVPGYLDCALNSVTPFNTVIFLSPDYISTGFDKFQQKRPIQNLILTETAAGVASGVVTFGTNFPYPIQVNDP